MPKHSPIPGLTIYCDERHFSGSFEDDGKHAGHTLDHCPFCGSNRLELTNTHTPSYWVRCLKCRAEAHGDLPAGGGEATPDERRALVLHLRAMSMAVRKWNKRIVDGEARS
ncbi:hypothetical protein PQQ51_06025 [Paraburkholderia xenovorans]|uniref:Lar family restriction alleviation protein n=1 Tax=Paraburkholderia xenovorans TaxID=36873 RepID=UPI0038B8D674